MCHLDRKITEKEYTGYKVALQCLKTGDYYSPAMGFKYEVGDVPVIERQNNLTEYFHCRILEKDNPAYSHQMKGRTAVFKSEFKAYDFSYCIYGYRQDTYKLVILEMTVAGSLREGKYSGDEVIGGKRIKSIKLYEELDRNTYSNLNRNKDEK